MSQKFKLNVNGKVHAIDADPDMPLLYALQERHRPQQPAVRLRARAVRRLHGASRRPADPLLHHAAVGGRATARW